MNTSCEVGVHADPVVLKIVGHHVSALKSCCHNHDSRLNIFISKIVCFIQTDVYLSKVDIIRRNLSLFVVRALPQMKHSSL